MTLMMGCEPLWETTCFEEQSCSIKSNSSSSSISSSSSSSTSTCTSFCFFGVRVESNEGKVFAREGAHLKRCSKTKHRNWKLDFYVVPHFSGRLSYWYMEPMSRWWKETPNIARLSPKSKIEKSYLKIVNGSNFLKSVPEAEWVSLRREMIGNQGKVVFFLGKTYRVVFLLVRP